MAVRECPNCGSYNGLDVRRCEWCGWQPEHDARTELAERALAAMVADSKRQRDSDERGPLLAIADEIAAELAALEAQP
jgi:uncharacterized membrane protein YvbJ